MSKLTEGPENRPEAFVEPWDILLIVLATPIQPIGQKWCLIVNSSSFTDSIGPVSYAEREPRVKAILEITIKHIISGQSAGAQLDQPTDDLKALQFWPSVSFDTISDPRKGS